MEIYVQRYACHNEDPIRVTFRVGNPTGSMMSGEVKFWNLFNPGGGKMFGSVWICVKAVDLGRGFRRGGVGWFKLWGL